MIDMSGPPPPPADPNALLALFFFAWRGFAAEPDAILAEQGLGRAHHRVLFTLVHAPGTRVGELAEQLGVSRQALHRTLSELRARGLVEARVPSSNARERALAVTARGAELEGRASGAQRAQLAAALAGVGADGAHAWTDVMRALAAPVVAASPRLREVLARPPSA